MKCLSRWLFAVAVAVVLCTGMWGCTDVDFHWYEHRSKASVIGFIDDSLVMVGDYRCWSEITDRWNGEYVELEGCGAERLCAYNYRVQENGPKLCDSLSSELATGMFGMKNQGSSTPAGQMTDSIIWAIRSSNSITLWKIGEGVHDFELSKSFNGCYGDFRINSIKQWFDGKFIVRGEKSLNAGGDTCQYAVLDTVARTLVYKRLEENLKWIEMCDDVRAWGDDVYCLGINEERNGFGLFVDDELKDSVLVDSVANVSSLWLSFEFEFMGDMIYFGHNINSIDYEKQKIKIYPNVKATSALNFVDENGNNVNYDF